MKYQAGEILIVRANVGAHARHLVGTECCVLAVNPTAEQCFRYLVHCVDGHEWGSAEYHLRRRDEPDGDEVRRESTVPWNECVWQPAHLRAPGRVPTVVVESDHLNAVRARIANHLARKLLDEILNGDSFRSPPKRRS